MKLYTDKAVADWLALTDRRVRQLRDEGVISERAPGFYDMKNTVTRYILYLRKGRGKTDYNDERAMLTRAKREAADMENEERRNNLHKTEDVERGIQAMCLNIRGRFSTLPAKLAGELAALTGGNQAAIYDALKRAIDETLEELSDYRVALATGSGNEEEE